MNKRLPSYIFIIALFLLASILSWKSYFKEYVQHDTVNIHNFPQSIGDWTSEEIPITEKEYEILETHNAFARAYTRKEESPIYLFIVYSQHNRKVSHPPEICYIGGGVSVLNKSKDFIALNKNSDRISVNKLLLERGNTQQVAYYWFKVGNNFVSNYWMQQLLITWKTIKGQPASSALIRLSATVENNNKQKAEKRIREFTRLITPELYSRLP